jgi:hypothetical protein
VNRYLKRSLKGLKDGEDVCLHCLLLAAHMEKWPKYRGKADSKKNKKAFDDLVYGATRITATVFAQIDEADQMKFMEEVMEKAKEFQTRGSMGAAILHKLREALGDGILVGVPQPTKTKAKPN